MIPIVKNSDGVLLTNKLIAGGKHPVIQRKS